MNRLGFLKASLKDWKSASPLARPCKGFYITYLLEMPFNVQRGDRLAADLQVVILSIIIGTLAAIVYSLRILVLMERRIARIDENLYRIAKRIVREEFKIEKEERQIAATLKRKK